MCCIRPSPSLFYTNRPGNPPNPNQLCNQYNSHPLPIRSTRPTPPKPLLNCTNCSKTPATQTPIRPHFRSSHPHPPSQNSSDNTQPGTTPNEPVSPLTHAKPRPNFYYGVVRSATNAPALETVWMESSSLFCSQSLQIDSSSYIGLRFHFDFLPSWPPP